MSPGHTPKMTVEMLVVPFLTLAGTCPGSSPCKPAQFMCSTGREFKLCAHVWHGMGRMLQHGVVQLGCMQGVM
jgi:hypothetical protein